jgi:hypothetical protein
MELKHLLSICLMLVISGSCSSVEKAGRYKLNVSSPGMPQVEAVEGAYEFVSETTILEKPERRSDHRTSSDWMGLWILQSGRFSQTLMKKGRVWSSFPQSPESMGYESFAGTYKLEGETLVLYTKLSLYPFATQQPVEFKFKFDGNTLTLTRTMTSYMENLSAGQQTIVLERVR